jgi:hypothetical protein
MDFAIYVTEILLLKGAAFFYLGKTQLPDPSYFVNDFLRFTKKVLKWRNKKFLHAKMRIISAKSQIAHVESTRLDRPRRDGDHKHENGVLHTLTDSQFHWAFLCTGLNGQQPQHHLLLGVAGGRTHCAAR